MENGSQTGRRSVGRILLLDGRMTVIMTAAGSLWMMVAQDLYSSCSTEYSWVISFIYRTVGRNYNITGQIFTTLLRTSQ